MKYGALARGNGSVYLRLPTPGKRYIEKIWDHAAGQIVIEEAGGKVDRTTSRLLHSRV